MSHLRNALADYLTLRRALGYKMDKAERLLGQFVAFAEDRGETHVRTATALAWATRPAGADAIWTSRRLAEVRLFARHLRTLDQRTEVPPADLLPAQVRRATPYLYTPQEIAALMQATGHLRGLHVQATYRTLIGLLAATGMRIGEAIGLDRDDFDAGSGIVTIRHGKFGKARALPLHPSTVAALADYLRRDDRPRPAGIPTLLVSSRGKRLRYGTVQPIFHKLLHHCSIAARSATCRPRIHDLRHSFAVSTIVDDYGARLLEQNVRTFLQARTKVNRGIIQTIDSSPEMFFAFNNGLTATAASVELSQTAEGMPGITAIRDLQIVNGGQTTASILYAQDRNKADLAPVFVQMKLSVVETDRIDDVVPLISRYANTQNRISEADFFSSHPFHVEMEKISRRLWAPVHPGSIAATKWFYERARGQYRDRQAYGTTAMRKKFEAEFPKDQTLQKTDLAKYEMTFDCKPHVVSQGAQKCFLAFAESISKAWESRPLDFNDEYFRHAVAKAILYRWTDRMVGRSDWYQADRGYKANIVAYTLAWLVNHLARERSCALDLARVWKMQDVPEEIQDALSDLAPRVAEIVKDPPPSVKNISEYAKQQACWARVAGTSLPVSEAIESATVDVAIARDEKKSAAAVKVIDRSIELETMLFGLVGRIDEIEQICRRHRLLSPRSAAALAKLKRGQTNLARSELNAMSNLIERLRDVGVDLTEIAGAE